MSDTRTFEKLGAFFLGRRYDMDRGEITPEDILYDAKDLTTHGLIVGMTGSGKTGLGIGLLEEAAIDGIPVIAIDPKGDLGNALLTFPSLQGKDFLPWVDEGEALRKGRTPEEHAKFLADLWRKGLADWGQGPDRIRRYEESAERVIFTPGSSAGVPIKILESFAAPAKAVLEDGDALRERILTAVSGLLALLGIDADPVRSREHILLSTILDKAWKAGRSLEIAELIREVQAPSFEQVGVFDLEAFYPSKERFELAMMLNNLLASPGFAAWTKGMPLDAQKLLYTDEGKPRMSILSIAHLSDNERMFFVTALLNEVLSWTRSQPGSRSLRAILYMDEVFGYFPPSANPPSKTPMLTLLKQARAYGLGVVLATQNPVDLDYKGLSNIGSWFLGRLQTERDKARVMEGLEGAAAASGSGFDKAKMEQVLAGLDSRVFLLNNVHEDDPVLFHTRWVLSYLGGPMTRQQIERLSVEAKKTLGAPQKAVPAEKADAATRKAAKASAVATGSAAATAAGVAPAAAAQVPERPMLPPGIEERFLAADADDASGRLIYRPALMARATLHYAKSTAKVDTWQETTLFVPLKGKISGSPWKQARELGAEAPRTRVEPAAGAAFADLPKSAADPKKYKQWEKMLKSWLYSSRPLTVWQCKALKAVSIPGESEGDFTARLRDLCREHRDLQVEKLRSKYAPKLARIKEQIDTAEARVEREKEQVSQKKMGTMLSIGTTVLGALFGRKLASATNVRRAGSSLRSASAISKEKGDVRRAEEKVDALMDKLKDMEQEFEGKVKELEDTLTVDQLERTEVRIAPRKGDMAITEFGLAWAPWRVDDDGIAEPVFKSGS
ncbi:ATP-binding protein [Acidobacteria bacterium Mor1]|nr:ATP-binding protein [Acidobacteria bacterium Mor1]